MLPTSPRTPIRVRTKLGKYRILQRLSDGGFARVYRALDTVEGVQVALKIPHDDLVTKQTLSWFRQEARVHAGLDHPNVLPVKNAEVIDGHFVIAYPLGQKSLSDRLRHRLSTAKVLDYAEQMLEAVAYAHERGIVHCDLKPDNFILFPGDRLRLGDFGVARIARRTIKGSGSGTVGFLAPEHAMGRTSFRADVFSLGLIMWLMLTGELPEWPFEWPPPGHERVRGRVHDDLLDLIRRALEIDPRKRFTDAKQMLAAFRRIKPRMRRHLGDKKRRRNGHASPTRRGDWKRVRFRAFQHTHGTSLATDRVCGYCDGPVAESMSACPWCGKGLEFEPEDTAFPDACPRCHRGRKLDWRFCGWCYGSGFDEVANRTYTDKRYTDTCSSCEHPLMPFMRYCPGCRKKLGRKWPVDDSRERCGRCGWGVVREYWEHCPWCGGHLHRR